MLGFLIIRAGMRAGGSSNLQSSSDRRDASVARKVAARAARGPTQAEIRAGAARVAEGRARVDLARMRRDAAVSRVHVVTSGPRDWSPPAETRAQRRARVVAFAQSRGA